jgi:hypothetical protein
MADHLILGCTQPGCANTVEIDAVPGHPEATKPFAKQAPGWGYVEQAGEGRLCCPEHYRP